MKTKIKKTATATVIIGVVMTLNVTAATVISITNPGFTDDTTGWTQLGPGGWGRSTGDGSPGGGTSMALNATAGIYQQTSGTITVGHTFTLDFIGKWTAGGNVKQVTVNFHDGSLASIINSQILTLTNAGPLSNGWQNHSVSFTAAATSSNALGISIVGIDNGGNWGGVDSLSLTAVPEPSSHLLLGAGICGALFLRRRRI